ncbi:MAG TPA: hypothetical protein ENH55_03985 [Aurantimonas coralicida]|uniref:Uncharacterized protein n=2 Tax=root TaxID=1 RepID=A0A9C9TG95_9HYPH|nr:hypothetical protein [Aurantimonas coralicida]HEU00092.1 hypothetical protein [Aurantimonas coralicida]
MTRGVSAFPSPFGVDSDLMFAGNGVAERSLPPGNPDAPAAPRARAKLALLVRPRMRRSGQKAAVQQRTAAPLVHHTPFRMEPAERVPQTVKLGRRGFYLRSRPADDAGLEDDGVRQSESILIPTAIVGAILASASYFFNFVG